MLGSESTQLLAQMVPPALVGELLIFGIFAMVAWAFLREAARIIVRVLLVVAVAVGIAVWTGLLEGSMAEQFFAWMGEGLLTGLKAVTGWLVSAWESIRGTGES